MSSLKKRNLLLVTFGVLTILFGSLFAFEFVKSPITSTSTTSLTFTKTETTTRYIMNQYYRTTSLTTAFTTSIPYYDNPFFTFDGGYVLVSVWVVEDGILLNLTCTPFFSVGDTFKYFITMENVNNTSHISTLQSYGQFNVTIYNSKGHAIYWNWYLYAWGPTGPPPPNFPIGANWTQISWWNTETNLPNQLGPGIPPAKPDPGNYTLIAQGTYYDIDLEKIEWVELLLPLTIR